MSDDILEARELRAKLASVERERDKWKANHDNQVKLRRALMDRPDLAERAKLVQKLSSELDAANARAEKLDKAMREINEMCDMEDGGVSVADCIGRKLVRLYARITELEADKSRLDWLADTAVHVRLAGGDVIYRGAVNDPELREAIDKARTP